MPVGGVGCPEGPSHALWTEPVLHLAILRDVAVIIVVYEAVGAGAAKKGQRAADEKDAEDRLKRLCSHHPIMALAPNQYKGA